MSTEIASEIESDKLDRTIAHLRNLSRTAVLQHALHVGKYLIEEYFRGDVGAYLDPSRSKHSSFNALLQSRRSELEELGLSARTLRNYISAWHVWQKLPEEVQRELDLTDLYKLSLVKDDEARTLIAYRAVHLAMNLQDVGHAVQRWQDERRAGQGRRGPKSLPKYLLQLRELDRLAQRTVRVIGNAPPPEGSARDRALAELTKLEAHLAAVKAALGVARSV